MAKKAGRAGYFKSQEIKSVRMKEGVKGKKAVVKIYKL